VGGKSGTTGKVYRRTTVRTFSYSDAKSHKFWNIELKGTSFTVIFGRIGTAGQTQTKTFADEEKARKEHDKLVREKLGKGYIETTPAAGSGPEALRAALEEAIREDPEDRTAHAAYADLLTEQGDPQGEFIQVQLALEDEGLPAAERKRLQQREEELLKAHRTEWVGEWADLAPTTGPEGRGQVDFPGPKPFRFIRGILAEVTIDELTLECAEAFVKAPRTRLVRRLFVGGYAQEEPGEYDPGDEDFADEYEPSRSILPRWPHFANLRAFQLGWTSDEVYDDYCHFQCHLNGNEVAGLVARMPRLEELYLFASGTDMDRLFGLKTLSHLRVLQAYHSLPYPLEKLASNPAFSRLTHLLLHPKARGDWNYGDEPYITLKGVQALLRSPHLKNLTHLRLRLTDIGDAGCTEIVRSGILKRLKMLDLRHGCVGDEGARVLAACPDLKNLELLDLSRNELSQAGITALQAVGIEVQTEHQHGPTTNIEDRQYLYEGDYE
jgi:uncharacterized protein (TIGR02996 family)